MQSIMKYQEKDINVGAFMNKSFNNFEIIIVEYFFS